MIFDGSAANFIARLVSTKCLSGLVSFENQRVVGVITFVVVIAKTEKEIEKVSKVIIRREHRKRRFGLSRMP